MTSTNNETASSTGGSAAIAYFERDGSPLRMSLFAHALRLTRNCADTEDLLQETMVERRCAPASGHRSGNSIHLNSVAGGAT
jgi:hypothetical protein